jgi:hypothetical protein
MILRPSANKFVPREWDGKIIHSPNCIQVFEAVDVCSRCHFANRPKPGDKTVDENLKQLFQQLGDAMNQSLADSDEVARVIGEIKSSGYDVFLAFEATIGFSKQDDEDDDQKTNGPTYVNAGREPEFKVNSQDERFLKSLRIRLDDAA